jgi:hypothetical protein
MCHAESHATEATNTSVGAIVRGTTWTMMYTRMADTGTH